MTEIVADGDPYAALPSTDEGEGDGSEYYYKIMVAMAIIACFALVAFLILLYFYMHQNITYTVTMNKPSKESKKNGANESTMFGNSGYKVFYFDIANLKCKIFKLLILQCFSFFLSLLEN